MYIYIYISIYTEAYLHNVVVKMYMVNFFQFYRTVVVVAYGFSLALRKFSAENMAFSLFLLLSS